MSWNEIIAAVLMSIGAFFAMTGSVGILQSPDFFRVHPAGKGSFGRVIITGLIFLVPWGIPGGWVVAASSY